MAGVIIVSVILASVTIMASLTYGKCNLWQVWFMASVTYGKCNYGKSIYGKSNMANETEPLVHKIDISDD